jgi:hypothetical protein
MEGGRRRPSSAAGLRDTSGTSEPRNTTRFGQSDRCWDGGRSSRSSPASLLDTALAGVLVARMDVLAMLQCSIAHRALPAAEMNLPPALGLLGCEQTYQQLQSNLVHVVQRIDRLHADFALLTHRERTFPHFLK